MMSTEKNAAAYSYDSVTGEYLHAIALDTDPLEPSRHILPHNATFTPPPKEKEGHVRIFRNNKWVSVPLSEELDPDQPVSEKDLLNRQLEHRLSLGLEYDFKDGRGVHHIGTSPQDMDRWLKEVSPYAQSFLNVDQPEGTLNIRTHTGYVSITAQEWQNVLMAIGEYRQSVYKQYFKIKDMDPPPEDVTDDTLWAPSE